MGLTVGCARCHDHKYDPMPQRDYTRLSAILRSAYDPYDWLSPNEADIGPDANWNESNSRLLRGVPSKEIEEAERLNVPIYEEIAKLKSDLENLTAPLWKKLFDEKWAEIPEALQADLREALDAPPEKRTDTQEYLAARFSSGLEVTSNEIGNRFEAYRLQANTLEAAIVKTEQSLHT